MRAWQAHAKLLRRASGPRRHGEFILLRSASVLSDGSCSKRQFSFSSKYPTSSESAVLDDMSANSTPQLVCKKCSTSLSPTKDLVFFKWRNGIHLSSSTDEALKNLYPENTVGTDDTAWKRNRMHCIKCNHHVGMLARVFSSDKILFSAANVAVLMPEDQSPLLSLSGYPSSLLGFTMWSELILMAETQPDLKESLQIRRVDNILDYSSDSAMLNQKLLMAKDLDELLRIVDENSLELNDVNIRTAIDRAARFVSMKSSRVNLQTVNHHTERFAKSEAPEDDLLAIPLPALLPTWTNKANSLDANRGRRRFWALIDETEKLLNFGVASFKNGNGLSSLMTALVRLGVGRKTILQPIAAQMVFMMEQPKPSINGYEASIVASSITNLLPKETRGEAWVLTALQAASKFVLAELGDENTSSKTKQRAAEVLIPLARSFLVVDSFNDELFRRLFEEININAGGLGNPSLPGFKRRLLQSKMYQVHLDCKLNDRASEFRLSSALEKEYQHVFDTLENQAKGSSFRLHHLVSNALDEIGFVNDVSFDTETGYHLDVVAPKEKIAIEINTAECYQTVEPGHEDQDPKTLGYVDLKARHLELLGWTVIQLNARNFQQLETQEERVMHMSMLLEVATNFKQKPATQAARTLAKVKKNPKKNPHHASLLERQR